MVGIAGQRERCGGGKGDGEQFVQGRSIKGEGKGENAKDEEREIEKEIEGKEWRK